MAQKSNNQFDFFRDHPSVPFLGSWLHCSDLVLPRSTVLYDRKNTLNIDISYLPDAQRFASPYVPTDECKKIGTEKQIRDLIFCLLLHAPNLELL